jgi:hypothetical protein
VHLRRASCIRVRSTSHRVDEGDERLTGKIVNTIPSHDVALRGVVDSITDRDQPDTAAELADRLRPLYPRIAVFERQLSGERAQFYVYRDGRYEPERHETWWDEPGFPSARVSAATGALTAVNDELAVMLRADVGDLLGRNVVDFVLPEARSAALAMFEAVRRFREVHSEALLRRPDGSTIAIEFRAVRRDGEIEVFYRPLEER